MRGVASTSRAARLEEPSRQVIASGDETLSQVSEVEAGRCVRDAAAIAIQQMGMCPNAAKAPPELT